MGACNFSTQENSLTVGIVPTGDDEEQDEYQYLEDWADQFVENLNDFIHFENPISYLTDEIFNVKMEYGYHEGFQLYAEDLDGAMGENALDYYYKDELEQEGADIEQIRTQFRKLWDTVQFLLIDFAKRAGLGITAGGYCGGVQFDHVDQVWNEYKKDADLEMLEDWEH
nr:MAG TPA: hypothetical protein [Caudoviricetes sp.]